MPIFYQGSSVPYDCEIIEIASANKGLTAAKYANISGAKGVRAVIQVQDAQVRYWPANAPKANEGIILNVMDTIVCENSNQCSSVRFIRTGSANANLHVAYYKR